jgi:hypothetical protein
MSMSEASEHEPEGEPAAPEVLPKVVDATSEEKPPTADSSADLPLPRWMFNLIGHMVAGILGLVLGYLILSWLRPLTFPLPWR